MKVPFAAMCPFCGNVTRFAVENFELEAYENGALAQNAFPNLSATEREVIVSGMCPSCQDNIFGGDEE